MGATRQVIKYFFIEIEMKLVVAFFTCTIDFSAPNAGISRHQEWPIPKIPPQLLGRYCLVNKVSKRNGGAASNSQPTYNTAAPIVLMQ